MAKAVVLAGGGARGSYHIGAWQALIELGYKPDIVTGTSVGSLNGVLMALDWFDVAKGMWLSIDDRAVMDIPEKVFSKETLTFARDFATKGGIGIEPLEKMITRFVDEDMLRASKCRYGLVTVNVNTHKPAEVTLEEIPHGKLIDYMLASSACFPVLRSRKIDGQMYIDGGYYDNMPSNLAVRMGADEIVEIDLDGFGVSRKLKAENVKVISVKSWHYLGGLLDFDPQNAKRNIELGYLDTYKAFGKLEGKAYAFRTGEIERMYTAFGVQFMELCEQMYETHSALRVAAEVYMRAERRNPKTVGDKFIAVLEGAMAEAKLPLGEVYTMESLVPLLKSARANPALENAQQLLKDSPLAKIAASVAAADIKQAYLVLIKTLL